MRTSNSISAAVEGRMRSAWPPAPRCASRRAQFSGWDAGPGWCSCVEEARMRGYGTETDVGVAEGLKFAPVLFIGRLFSMAEKNGNGGKGQGE